MSRQVDVLIVGGGINGAAVARDVAGRGRSVYLAEKSDYASGTSSASSKLIHGGLRYLEQREFRLVREALAEREIMLRMAPHIVKPMRFLIPIRRDQRRPPWMVHLGLWLYDRLAARRQLAKSGRLDAAGIAAIPGLRPKGLKAVLHYPDCWTDDARLTLACVLDGRDRGADVGNYREVVRIRPESDAFTVTMRETGAQTTLRAKHIVNAAGPWANLVLDRVAAEGVAQRPLRLVRGSHIVVPMSEPKTPDAFTLQNDDGRVVFVLPWLERFLIIGTTDVVHDVPLENVRCSDEERAYLLACYHRFFDRVIEARDVVWSFSGVRPLVDDGAANPAAVSRDHELHVQRFGRAVLLTVYGGKLTSHRVVAEEVCRRLKANGLSMGESWTATEPLHGGEAIPTALAAMIEEGPDIALAVKRRWVSTYGSHTRDLYERIARDPALGNLIAPGVAEAELDYAARIEDARTAEDFLYRRTKLFLDLDVDVRTRIARWFEEHVGATGAERTA